MTSATVTQLGEMIANISNNISNMDSQNGEFAGIFQTASEKTEGLEKQDNSLNKISVIEKPMSVSKKADELNGKKTEMLKEEPVDAEKIENELETAVEELKVEIAEQLDISMEELEAVMETLGLTNASLFTQEGMAALVMNVEQITEPVELLINEGVYQTLQELNQFTEQLLGNVKEQLQLTDNQFEQAITEFAETEGVMQNAVQEEVTIAENETNVTEVSVENVEETNEQKTVSEKTETATEETNQQQDADGQVTVESGNQDEASKDMKHHSQSEQNSRMTADNSVSFNNTQTVNPTTIEFNGEVSGNHVNAQEIYDQIGDYIKTNIRPGISEVEMQLNPENLGTVNIHLSSKQGNVTAQLTVQNELVKAAMEVQLVQLKENFAEQGIKVDAVEVTVESHAFNQNMQQSNEENGQAQTTARRNAIRSINLNGDWADEELTEEEQLVAEMMEADGNTVDYKA